jgi:hypothetical protein
MEPKFPPELVLLATVHGGLLVNENKQIETFVVPQGFKITRVMATRPGICNVTTSDQIDEVVRDMREFGFSNVEETIQKIRASQPEVVKSILGQLKGENENKALFEQFVRSRIATPTTKVFTAGNTMLNKLLIRYEGEGEGEAFDFKLNAMNMPGRPDLFNLLLFKTSGPATQTRAKNIERWMHLTELVEELKSRGVNHLVFYDLTCSSFMPDTPMTDREERALRRDIVQTGLGKRKTRRPKRKTKTRRGKKRTTLWKH